MSLENPAEIAELVDLPEGAIVTDVVVVVGYMEKPEDDDDNGARWGAYYDSDAPSSTTIGLLSQAQHYLMHPPDDD